MSKLTHIKTGKTILNSGPIIGVSIGLEASVYQQVRSANDNVSLSISTIDFLFTKHNTTNINSIEGIIAKCQGNV